MRVSASPYPPADAPAPADRGAPQSNEPFRAALRDADRDARAERADRDASAERADRDASAERADRDASAERADRGDQSDRLAGDRDRHRLDSERNRLADDRDRRTDDRDRVAGDRDRLAVDRDHLAGNRDRLAGDRDRLAGAREHGDDTMAPPATQAAYLARAATNGAQRPSGGRLTPSVLRGDHATGTAATSELADARLAPGLPTPPITANLPATIAALGELGADPAQAGAAGAAGASSTARKAGTAGDSTDAGQTPGIVDSSAAALALSSLGLGGIAPPIAGGQIAAPATVEISDPAAAQSPAAALTGPRDPSAADDRLTMPPQLPEAAIDAMTAAALRAAYGVAASAAGAGAAGTGDPGPAAAIPGNATDPSRAPIAAPGRARRTSDGAAVATWMAAAIGRAGGSLGSDGAARAIAHAEVARSGMLAASPAGGSAVATATATGDATAAQPAPAITAPNATAALHTAPGTASTAATLTPLEQAVHELVGRAGGAGAHGRARPGADAEASALPALPDPTAQPVAATAPLTPDAPTASSSAETGHGRPTAIAQPPEPPANPSHVHLVIDDGPERVVATVAVRGTEVHVALRATDDATAAALARNAASLDHAMHGRGLSLNDLSAEREPRDHRQPKDAEPRERRPRDAERFQLEENL